VYPAFLAVVMTLAMIVIINVVLPSFAKLYSDSNIPMPTATLVLLRIGDFLHNTIYFQMILSVGLVLFLRWLLTTVAGKRIWDQFLLVIPKIGTLYHMYHSSVFARTLSILLSGGMPIVQALDVIQRTTPSASMQSRLIKVSELVRAGSSLHLALEEAKMLHPLAVEMTRVGEQSSALPDMLNYVADFFDQEVEKATTIVTTLIGPIMILIMGILVMGLLLAVYAPLFEVNNIVQ
jgi:type IV pilus assembly protein PilC